MVFTIVFLLGVVVTLPFILVPALGWMPTASCVLFGAFLTWSVITVARARLAPNMVKVQPAVVEKYKTWVPYKKGADWTK